MPLFEADEQTQGIVVYTEPGGRIEAELPRGVTEPDSRPPLAPALPARLWDRTPATTSWPPRTTIQ